MNEKAGIGVWILIIVFIVILGVGCYLFIHNKQPMLKDPDGKDYYTHGFTYERTLFGWQTYTGDKCEGDILQEAVIQEDNEVIGRYYATRKTYECPNGCSNGACIN